MALLLAGLSSSLADSSTAIPQPGASQVSSFSANIPILATSANRAPAYMNYLKYDSDAARGNRLPVAAVSVVDIWTLLAVMFGLVAFQLWNRGARRPPPAVY